MDKRPDVFSETSGRRIYSIRVNKLIINDYVVCCLLVRLLIYLTKALIKMAIPSASLIIL